MNYTEAMEKSLTVKWKTDTCNAGEKCWCRLIVPEDEIECEENEEIYIAGSGTISKLHAEHIVYLHNQSIKLANLHGFIS